MPEPVSLVGEFPPHVYPITHTRTHEGESSGLKRARGPALTHEGGINKMTPPKVPINWNKVRKMFRNGDNAADIAAQLGLNPNTLRSRMRREGVKNPVPRGRPRKDRHT